MDIGAYANIDNLRDVMESNGIEVPRLRGLRLMCEEFEVLPEDIERNIQTQNENTMAEFCCSVPSFTDSNIHVYGQRSYRRRKKYLITEKYTYGHESSPRVAEKTVGIRWELIHGKARKRLKLALKHNEKNIRKQYEMFNRYVGRDDVLYIHARCGSQGWGSHYIHEIRQRPWFIDMVDDAFDRTYCDIYAKI